VPVPKQGEPKRPRTEGPSSSAFSQWELFTLKEPPSPLAARVPISAAFGTAAVARPLHPRTDAKTARVPSKVPPAGVDASAVLLSTPLLLPFTDASLLPANWIPRAASAAARGDEGPLLQPTSHAATAPAAPAPQVAPFAAAPGPPRCERSLFSDSEEEDVTAIEVAPLVETALLRPKPASWRVPDERLEEVVARSSFLADLRLLLRVC